MAPADWQRSDRAALTLLFDAPATSTSAARWLVLLNAGTEPLAFTLPPGRWECRLASDASADMQTRPIAGTETLAPATLWLAKMAPETASDAALETAPSVAPGATLD